MQNHAVPLLDEELRGHSAQPIGRTRDEHTCHLLLFLLNACKTAGYVPVFSASGIATGLRSVNCR
jgi:hypothetical protein